MWPTLLNMSRDECRRTLRRLELEAYANVVSVFRAQGSLEESRKKILDDLRGVLHIGRDRHTAEARRVANDELLATIAEQLIGPNTGLSWALEGRRLVPLMPRLIPQTAFAELADIAAAQLQGEAQTQPMVVDNDDRISNDRNNMDIPEATYPIVTEDLSSKIVEEELLKRKRKLSEVCLLPEEGATPNKSVKNTNVHSNQKHHNIGLIYSSFNAKPSQAKMTHSKHSYNQVGKVPNKSSQQPKQRKPRQPRQPKQQRKIVLSKSQMRKLETAPMAQNMPAAQPPQHEYSNTGATYLGSYIQSLSKPNTPTKEEIKINRKSGVIDPSTMKLLSEEDMIEHPDERVEQPQGTVIGKHIISGKTCQLIIKKKDHPNNGIPKLTQIPLKQDNIKLVQPNRPVLLSNSTSKYVNTPMRPVTPKNFVPKQPTRLPTVPSVAESVVVTSTSPTIPKVVAKNVVVATSNPSPPSKEEPTPKIIQLSPKPDDSRKIGDHSNSKTFLLNQKVGQKMVVLKGKTTTKPDGQATPVILKGVPMKFVPVSSQNIKYNNYKVVTTSAVSTPTSHTNHKIIKLDTVKAIPNALKQNVTPIRHLNSKGMVVLPKGTPLVKPIQFTKTCEVTKIIMKNQLPKQDAEKIGNIVVVGVNNEQKTLETPKKNVCVQQKITEDTPIIFDSQPIDDSCNANSMDSMTDSNADQTDSSERKENNSRALNDMKEAESVKDNSSTDWEMEVESDNKEKNSLKGNSVEVVMSSDSEIDAYLVKTDKKVEKEAETSTELTGEAAELYRTSRTLLSQLQDDGSSTDSSLNLKSNNESNKVDNRLANKEDTVKPLHKPRSDIYSSGLVTNEMKIDPFGYLEDEIMSGDQPNIEIQLSNMLGESNNSSNEQRTIVEKVPAAK